MLPSCWDVIHLGIKRHLILSAVRERDRTRSLTFDGLDICFQAQGGFGWMAGSGLWKRKRLVFPFGCFRLVARLGLEL